MASNTASGPSSGAPSTPGRIVSEFSSRAREEQAGGWSALWDSGQGGLWDRGKPSPALVDLVESGTELIPKPDGMGSGGRRPRVLVPGCGKGYDVVMLALHGYDAVGLDVSRTGVETARVYAAAQLAAPEEYNFARPEKYAACERGRVKFVAGDFFAKDWETECCSGSDDDDGGFAGFDVIYDYTFLCALLPEMRKDWACRMSELLSPSGVLVCLEFPLYKDLKLLGPPWPLREGIYWNLLVAGGDGILQDEDAARAAAQSPSSGGSFGRLGYIKPERTYEASRGTDMLSIWGLNTRGRSQSGR
ncbi:S-adenosyl-L-methionine-dependent methyltransferase [Parachaetomium inaequale]|uniref:S-adenosyl-L-methionine-dependent methyltransferase n=1 Tax=Parachaetomium inaequale TaxID=2588326 RepID=A0AAN6SQ56_9PEZI|nr:S-adenosyl-L-methionine-dependent methyltransferase [Parachaetomium inaequale]